MQKPVKFFEYTVGHRRHAFLVTLATLALVAAPVVAAEPGSTPLVVVSVLAGTLVVRRIFGHYEQRLAAERDFLRQCNEELRVSVEELEATAARFRDSGGLQSRFFEGVPLAMGVVEITPGDDIRHLLSNPATASFFECDPEELQEWPNATVELARTQKERWIECCRDSESAGRSVRFEFGHVVDRTTRWFGAAVSYLESTPAGHPCFAYVVEDITERKRLEQPLESALRSAQTSDKLKSDFLAHLGLEIRTPLNAILGFSEFLLDDDLSEEERVEAIETITRSSRDLMAMVDDVVDHSRIEAGTIAVETVACDPFKILREVHAYTLPRAEAKRLDLQVLCATPIPETIHSDPKRLRQILVHLVSAAIRLTPAGTVLACASFQDETEPSTFEVSVMDSGEGMTRRQLKTVFKPYVRTEPLEGEGETGLGLVISKRLAHLLGGDVQIYSKPDRGSVFRAAIPSGPVAGVRRREDFPAEIEAVKDDETPVPHRVLIAEDSLVDQRLLTRTLQRRGAEVVCVSSGEEAVTAVEDARRAGAPFDLVLLDLELPDLDGYGAARKLRGDGHEFPIVAMSGDVHSCDRERCLEAGCDALAEKPIERRVLFEQIARAVGRKV